MFQVDKFNMEAVDLGQLFKIKIRHDNAMFSPAWFLEKVEITDMSDNEKYVFYCERWLGKNKDDGKIDRTLYVKVSVGFKKLAIMISSSCLNHMNRNHLTGTLFIYNTTIL